MTASEPQLVAVSIRIALSHSTVPDEVASCVPMNGLLPLFLYTHIDTHTHTRACNHTCMHTQTYCGLVTKLCLTLLRAHTIAFQEPLSMGFSRQEHWSGQPFPSSGIYPSQNRTRVSRTGRRTLYYSATRGLLLCLYFLFSKIISQKSKDNYYKHGLSIFCKSKNISFKCHNGV